MQVEMEQVFTGFVSLLEMKGKPGATVTIMASAIPFCGSVAYTSAAAEGRPYCAGVKLDLPSQSSNEYPAASLSPLTALSTSLCN